MGRRGKAAKAASDTDAVPDTAEAPAAERRGKKKPAAADEAAAPTKQRRGAAAAGGKKQEEQPAAAPAAAADEAAAPAKRRRGAATGKKQEQPAAAAAAGEAAAPAKRRRAAAAAGKKQQAQEDEEPPAAAAAEEDEEPEQGGSEEGGSDSDVSSEPGSGEGEGEEEDADEDEDPEYQEFMEEIHAREAELGKHCVVLEMLQPPEPEEGEDEPAEGAMLDALRRLKHCYVPSRVQDVFIDVFSELSEVGSSPAGSEDEAEGQEAEVAAFMQMFLGRALTTRHAADMHGILKGRLASVAKGLKARKWQEAFEEWLATVLAARRESHWFEDTDVPDEVVSIFEQMRSQWLLLRKRSDEELGGLECGAPSGSDPKQLLGEFLCGLGQEINDLGMVVRCSLPKA